MSEAHSQAQILSKQQNEWKTHIHAIWSDDVDCTKRK